MVLRLEIKVESVSHVGVVGGIHMVVYFVRKTCGTFENKTVRTFVNRVVFTKIV